MNDQIAQSAEPRVGMGVTSLTPDSPSGTATSAEFAPVTGSTGSSAPAATIIDAAPTPSSAPTLTPATTGADIFTLLSSEATRSNPYPVYAQLRNEQRILDTGAGVWFLFGFDDCNRLLRNNEAGRVRCRDTRTYYLSTNQSR